MNRNLAIALIVIFALLAAFGGYRAYQIAQDRDLAARQAANERAELERQKAEADRKTAAETEARRLAEQKAQEEAALAVQRITQLKTEQAATESARQAAAQAAEHANSQLEKVRHEKEAADAEIRRLIALREKEAADAEATRLETIRKLQALERQNRELAEREAARLAAAEAQKKQESAWKPGPITERSIFPVDYKRRSHYYQQVFTLNAESQRPPASSK